MGKNTNDYMPGFHKITGVISVRLTKDIEKYIIEQAEKAGVTKSFVVNEILKKWKRTKE